MNKDQPFRTDDLERAREEQRLRDTAEEIRLEGDVKTLLATESGRRMARLLMSWTGVFRSVPPSEATHMSYECGRRDIGARFIDLLARKDLKGFLKTIEEQTNG